MKQFWSRMFNMLLSSSFCGCVTIFGKVWPIQTLTPFVSLANNNNDEISHHFIYPSLRRILFPLVHSVRFISYTYRAYTSFCVPQPPYSWTILYLFLYSPVHDVKTSALRVRAPSSKAIFIFVKTAVSFSIMFYVSSNRVLSVNVSAHCPREL